MNDPWNVIAASVKQSFYFFCLFFFFFFYNWSFISHSLHFCAFGIYIDEWSAFLLFNQCNIYCLFTTKCTFKRVNYETHNMKLVHGWLEVKEIEIKYSEYFGVNVFSSCVIVFFCLLFHFIFIRIYGIFALIDCLMRSYVQNMKIVLNLESFYSALWSSENVFTV